MDRILIRLKEIFWEDLINSWQLLLKIKLVGINKRLNNIYCLYRVNKLRNKQSQELAVFIDLQSSSKCLVISKPNLPNRASNIVA